jgi:hypothetical protein
MARGKQAFLLVAAVIALVLAVRWLGRQVEIDRCLDAGKCWDAATDACNFDGTGECKPGGAGAR